MQVTHLWRSIVLLTFLFTCALGTRAQTILFSDPLNGTSLSSAWTTYNGAWSENGMLSQTDGANWANTKKASVTNSGVAFPSSLCVKAKIRVDTWTPGDGYCFAGIGVMNNPANGEGYDLVFDARTPNTVSFLYDDIVWGTAFPFTWTAGTWYWFKEAYDASTSMLYGKVWADGAAEPSGWMFTQTGWAPTGYSCPCINGGGRGCTLDAGDFSVADYGILAANDDTYMGIMGQELDVTADNGVLANDTAADGNALIAQLVDGPDCGQLTLNPDGSFSYTPDTWFFGTDSFTYNAVDGDATSNIATVTITVQSPVTANNDSYFTHQGQTLAVTAAQMGLNPVIYAVFAPDAGKALPRDGLSKMTRGALCAF